MTTDERFDAAISTWFEETGPARLPERVLNATFERTRTSRQHVGWRALLGKVHVTRPAVALGGAAVVVLAAALALELYVNRPSIGGPLFQGTWVNTTDSDGGTQTMTVRASGDGAVEIVVLDDIATVCSGGPSTMTGTGRLEGSSRLVIPSPVYTCDDGSEPKALSGPPLAEQLRDLTFVYHTETDTLTLANDFASVWRREGAQDLSPGPAMPGIMWPQSSLEEVRLAQERADAGDPRYTWQVDPKLAAGWDAGDAEIVARFLREELGWEEYRSPFGGGTVEYGGGTYPFAVIIRCAPGRTNPLYPDEECAPQIDDVRYEQVFIELARPARQDASGIWVVTRAPIGWFEQMVPPAEAEVTALLEAFLQARIEGEGAEQYLYYPDPGRPTTEVPLLYATTTGATYERLEFEVVDGPEWPDGWMRIKVRLFAEGGETVVEQLFRMNRDQVSVENRDYTGRLGLYYVWSRDIAPTTENGQAVPVQYRFLDGEVTFSAPWPWETHEAPQGPSIITLKGDPYDARIAVVADPRPTGSGCQEGPAPADAEALVRSIRSDPDLEATPPVAVSVGGIPALQMDVTAAPGASVCEAPYSGAQVLVTTDDNGSYSGLTPGEGGRMRLYLLDLPGRSPRILAIAITAPEPSFERVMEEAAPIVESIEFPSG